ncbi:MAG: N-acetylmuramidase domain-containing protein [Pseudomonadota bacterium]
MARLKPSDITGICDIADKNGIEPAALLAVVHVESGGRTGATVNGKFEPLIRFEGHYFDRRLSGKKRERARSQDLASPSAGVVKNPASQSARFAMLDRASAIDVNAAMESCSWGVGQVMGAHWKSLGFDSVKDMVNLARRDLEGQVELMVRFIEKNGLINYLKSRNWIAFARRYNGPAFHKNRYDEKIARAYSQYRATLQADRIAQPTPRTNVLQFGHRGPRVQSMQEKLNKLGYKLTVDGIFGSKTRIAVQQFQVVNGLVADAKCGPNTLRALDQAIKTKPKNQTVDRISRLLKWIARLLKIVPKGLFAAKR